MSTIHTSDSKSKTTNSTSVKKYSAEDVADILAMVQKKKKSAEDTKDNKTNNNTSQTPVLDKLEDVTKFITSLPNTSTKDTASLMGLGAVSPAFGMTGLLLNSMGINPSKVVKGTAKLGWSAVKGINNKIHGRKWNDNNSLGIFRNKNEGGDSKSGGAISKSSKNSDITKLEKTVKKGFKDVLSYLKKNKGKSSDKKDHGWLWMIGSFLLGIIGKIGSFIGNTIGGVGKGLLGLLGLDGDKGGLLKTLLTGTGGKGGLLNNPLVKGAGKVALAGAAGLAVGKGTEWVAGKLGADENQAKGWGKVTGLTTTGYGIGKMFGPEGAAIGAALGALAGVVWHTVTEFKRISKETKKIGDSLKNYSLEDIKAGKAVNDENVPEVSNGAWSRSLSWVGAQFDDELAADREKAEAQRLAVNAYRANHFKTAQYGSIEDILKDKDLIDKTLKNQGWFSKSSSEAANSAKKAMSTAIMDYIDKQGAIGDTDKQRKGNRQKAINYIKEQTGLSSSDIKNMYNAKAVENNDFSSFDGSRGSWFIEKAKKWFTKQNNKSDDNNTKATTDNTDAIAKLNETLSKLLDPNGMTTEGQYGNNTTTTYIPPQQTPVIINNQSNSTPVNNILAGLTN